MYITDNEILDLSTKFFTIYGDVLFPHPSATGGRTQALIDFAHAILDRAAECSTLSGS